MREEVGGFWRGERGEGYGLYEHDHIMREGDFDVCPAVLCVGQFVGIRRPVAFYILIQGRCCAVPGFDLNRDYSAVFFNKELNFMEAVRLVIIQAMAAFYQAFGDYIFIYPAARVSGNGVIQYGEFGLKPIHRAA